MKGLSKRALGLTPMRNTYAIVKEKGCGRVINEENNP